MTDTTPKYAKPPKQAPSSIFDPIDKNDKGNQKSSYMAQMKGKGGFDRIVKAFGYSKDGLQSAYRSEMAFRQVVWLNGVLVVVALCVPFGVAVKMILLFASVLSLIVELFNTGLEAVVDRISDEFHPLSKVAKDVGSAAQLLTLVLLAVLWVLAFVSL